MERKRDRGEKNDISDILIIEIDEQNCFAYLLFDRLTSRKNSRETNNHHHRYLLFYHSSSITMTKEKNHNRRRNGSTFPWSFSGEEIHSLTNVNREGVERMQICVIEIIQRDRTNERTIERERKGRE